MELEDAKKLAALVNEQEQLGKIIETCNHGKERFPYITIKVNGFGFQNADVEMRIENDNEHPLHRYLINGIILRREDLEKEIKKFKIKKDEIH